MQLRSKKTKNAIIEVDDGNDPLSSTRQKIIENTAKGKLLMVQRTYQHNQSYVG